MRLLDLFCCAGGSAMGYHQAGFDEIVGVDIAPQPRYPFRFVQADALEYVAAHGHEFDAIHASPPCQAYSHYTPKEHKANHPRLINDTRNALKKTGKPYVIENVSGARRLLRNPVMLCGTMFGLDVWRHRYFEIWPDALLLTPSCQHVGHPVLITGTTRIAGKKRVEHNADQCRVASGIDWMTRKEMDEAIPPAYTKWIGRHLLTALQVAA